MVYGRWTRKIRLSKQGISSLENMMAVPGPETAFEDNKSVPHGEVREVWYSSNTLGMMRRMHVYTPPGYEKGVTKYPVFYLLHGAGDDDSGWNTIGRAGFILNNLIAAGKSKPMIVVMPNGSMPMPPSTGMPNPADDEPDAGSVLQRISERGRGLLSRRLPYDLNT